MDSWIASYSRVEDSSVFGSSQRHSSWSHYVCVCVCVCVCLCLYLCVCVCCVCVYLSECVGETEGARESVLCVCVSV